MTFIYFDSLFINQVTDLDSIHLVSTKYKDITYNHFDEAPYPRDIIDDIRRSALEAKEEANLHTRNSWEALGNREWGTCVVESLDGIKCLRKSELLEKEAVKMENENLKYYQQGK